MKPIYYFICRVIRHIRISGQQFKLELKRSIYSHASLRSVDAKSDSCACINFPPSFSTNINDMFFKCQLIDNLTPSNFSHSLFFMSYSNNLILMVPLELTSKLHLSASLFNKLFANHTNKAFEFFSKTAILMLFLKKPFMSSAIAYKVLSSAQPTVSTSFKMKNKKTEKMC